MSIDLLWAYGWPGVILIVWLGLCVGSFLNVVIYRLPVMMHRDWRDQAKEILSDTSPGLATPLSPSQTDQSALKSAEKFNLMVPRSRCPNCEHQITALENIPVISWLMLKRRCASCKVHIPARYPAIEILTALVTVAVIAKFGFSPLGFWICLASWMLVAATFIDFDTQLLPDQLTIPLLWMGLAANTLLVGIVALPHAVIGAMAGYLFLWSIYWAFKLLTGKEGMGYGDFKLLAALGAWLGWQALPSIMLISALLGLLYALTNVARGRQQSSQPIPFGPFLATAGWVTFMFRDNVLGLFAL